MDFSEALKAVKAGKRITRTRWNGPNQYVALQRDEDGSRITVEYLYICTVDGHYVPWLASQTDVLADDWEIV